MNVKGACLLGAACVLVPSGNAAAGEGKTYTYDALGRLVAVKHTGGGTDGRADSLCYDPAGNRVQYASSAAGTLASCAAAPPPPSGGGGSPPPPAGNQPPVANPDTLSAQRCEQRTVNVLLNDTDPEGNVPLSLTGVTGDAWVASSTSVGLMTPDTNGSYTINYTVADSLGATSTGTLTVTVSGTKQCV